MNIENKKQLATLLLAVGLGLVASFMTSQYIKGSIESQTQKLAADYAGKNKALAQEMQANLQALNQKIEQQKAALARQEAEMKKQIQIAASSPRQAAPRPEEVVDATIFSVVTPPGRRAYTININTLAAVGGLINPGDHVDIFADLKIPKGKTSENVTSVLFQKVLVLSVNGNFRPVGDSKIYDAQRRAASLRVTLALTPEEVNLMRFAEKHGNFQFTLRSPAEQGTETFQIASWEALSDYVFDASGIELDVPKAKVQTKDDGATEEIFKDEEPARAIEIYRGGRAL